MSKHSPNILYLAAILMLGSMAVIPDAMAKCGCPSDGNSTPAAMGLGEAFPQADDLAVDPAWQVYEFERDGIRYTQVNDGAGNVRAATGRIGDILWVMPIGRDADRVSLPDDALPVGQPRVLYRSEEVEVVLYQDGSQQRWLIRAR